MTLFDEISGLETLFSSDVEVVDGLMFSTEDVLKEIMYITHSVYMSGMVDHLGKDKPYLNISNFRLNVAIRATDFDTKDIHIESEQPGGYMRSLILGKEVQKWMRDVTYARTLNEMGEVRPRDGFLLVKKTVIGGKLNIEVVNLRACKFNPVNIASSPIIEYHDMTIMDLVKKRGVWDHVEALIDRIYDEEDVIVKEVTGWMPASYFNEGSRFDYKIYKAFVSEVEGQKVVLWHKEQKELGYKWSAWHKRQGLTVGRGIIEDGFQAQHNVNYAKIAEKRILDVASASGFVTDDDMWENNVTTDLDPGYIMKVGQGKTFKMVNTLPNSIPTFENYIQSFDEQYEKVSSTFGAILGETSPANTPLGSLQIQNQEASSLFSYRREEAGILQDEIFDDWVIPHLGKKVNKKHLLDAEYTAAELEKIDDNFARNRALKQLPGMLSKSLSSGEAFSQESLQALVEQIKGTQRQFGDRRFLSIPDGYFKDTKLKVRSVSTNEQRNKGAVLQSLDTILQRVQSSFDPNTGQFGVLEDPRLNRIFGQMIEMSGTGLSAADFQPGPSNVSDVKKDNVNTPKEPELVTATAQEQNA